MPARISNLPYYAYLQMYNFIFTVQKQTATHTVPRIHYETLPTLEKSHRFNQINCKHPYYIVGHTTNASRSQNIAQRLFSRKEKSTITILYIYQRAIKQSRYTRLQKLQKRASTRTNTRFRE